MSSRLLAALCALSSVLAVGCAQGPDAPEYVSRDEVAALPEGCAEMLSQGAHAVAIGSVEGSDQVVLETDQGRCVDRSPALIDTLRFYDQDRTALELARFVSTHRSFEADPAPHPDTNVSSDPSPHPDVSTSGSSSNPSPHPDVTTGTGTTAADPSPHPDADPDADNGVVIIIWIIIEDSPTGGGGSGAPTTPPQPQPRSDG